MIATKATEASHRAKPERQHDKPHMKTPGKGAGLDGTVDVRHCQYTVRDITPCCPVSLARRYLGIICPDRPGLRSTTDSYTLLQSND